MTGILPPEPQRQTRHPVMCSYVTGSPCINIIPVAIVYSQAVRNYMPKHTKP